MHRHPWLCWFTLLRPIGAYKTTAWKFGSFVMDWTDVYVTTRSERSLRCVQVLRPRGTFIDRVIRRLRFYREVSLSERMIVLVKRHSTLCRFSLQIVGRCKDVRLHSTSGLSRLGRTESVPHLAQVMKKR